MMQSDKSDRENSSVELITIRLHTYNVISINKGFQKVRKFQKQILINIKRKDDNYGKRIIHHHHNNIKHNRSFDTRRIGCISNQEK